MGLQCRRMNAALPEARPASQAPPHRPEVTDSFRSMIYFAVTGARLEEWLSFQRNVRIVRMCTSIMFYIGKMVVLELFFNWLGEGFGGRQRLRERLRR